MDALSRLETALEGRKLALAVSGLQTPKDRSLYGFGELSGTFNGLQMALDELKEIRKDLDEKDDTL